MQLCSHCAQRNCYRPVEPAHRMDFFDVLLSLFGYRPHRCAVCDVYSHLRVEKVDWVGILILLALVLIIISIVVLPTFLS